ncbi:zinc-containing alcohol dehydrogenase (ADH) [Tieghemostelium lacteum]|uniref:Zinc-containing alcohol dehydrogenase (ADH) n=1 Tax=Tieghemostelium lacteum TaxID=361077 RepID=A0A151Z8B0_TIELA|nr:zinc-containing alcohol dehydrogenase (ADH) [Tieghemostelium lacteum]|eukprot:KYQ90190.1 zinc-containing alcohol dehydrogenase (ADH) [Tieghemostelium lacteum]
MKAAVLHEIGKLPKFEETYPIPVVENAEQQQLVKVLSSSIKNLDRGKVSGKHYMSYNKFPTTVGIDGVVELDNGDKAYAFGITGMIAEKALIGKGKYVVLDKDVDPLVASALPNAILGADMAMLIRGQLKEGQTVLVNGATGVTGKVALQLARIHGAKKIIAMGRDKQQLEDLQKRFKLDEIIVISDNDQEVIDSVKTSFQKQPIDLVLDYLWGRPTDLVLKAIVAAHTYHITKVVTIGEMAGASITLSSATLRSTAIEILGSGLGSFPQNAIEIYMKNNLNNLLKLATQGKLTIDINTIELKDIEKNWLHDVKGQRTVVKIN